MSLQQKKKVIRRIALYARMKSEASAGRIHICSGATLRNSEHYLFSEVVKFGDTAADMQEGKNAGCVTVGVIKGSNMLGLGEEEFNALSSSEAAVGYETAKNNYIAAGADYVLDDITALPELIDTINKEAK